MSLATDLSAFKDAGNARMPKEHSHAISQSIEDFKQTWNAANAIDVGGPQVHVADSHARIDRVRRNLDRRYVALGHAPEGTSRRPRSLRSSTTTIDLVMLSGQLQIGAVFPQTELGGDPGAVRAWVQAVTDLGYSHIAVFDHVGGADPRVHAGWDRPYTVDGSGHMHFRAECL